RPSAPWRTRSTSCGPPTPASRPWWTRAAGSSSARSCSGPPCSCARWPSCRGTRSTRVTETCSPGAAWPPPPRSPPRRCGAAAASIAFLTQRTQRGNGEDAETDSNGRRAGRPDPEAAQKLLQRRKRLESDLDLLKRLQRQEDDTRVLVEWLEGGEDVEKDLKAALDALDQTLEGAEFQKMLGGEHDRASAILTINSGAGGTESQDWAEMLLRMYLRWCDRHGYKRDLIDLQPGEEAGIKSATVLVQGEYAYGYLSAEVGVHRLVRISPFDSAARRHTSFASVFVWPEIDEAVKIEVQDKDLRIDTYRSSGAGGQH